MSRDGWTTGTLHAHFCELITAHHDHVGELDAATQGRLTSYIAWHAQIHERAQVHVDGQVHELVDQLRRENSIRDAATAEAIHKAEQANDKRFDSVNEFRSSLSDQAQSFLRRDEYLTQHAALIDKIAAVGSRLDKIEGKTSGTTATYAAIIASVGMLTAVVSVVILLLNHV